MEQAQLMSEVVIALFTRWNDLEESKAGLDPFEGDEFSTGRFTQMEQEQRFINDLIFRVKYEQTAAIPSPEPNPEPIQPTLVIHPATGTQPRLLY